MKVIGSVCLLLMMVVMVGCFGEVAPDGPLPESTLKDPGVIPFHPLDAGEVEASPPVSDGGHKCKGVCTAHYGWVYDCEGPPKVDCWESLLHSCHADLCPVCVLTPGQDAGGIVSEGCMPAPNPPSFTWFSQDDAGNKVTNACNVPHGCPSGSACQVGTDNVLTGTCL